MKKRIFSFLMALVMVLSILPMPALAADGLCEHHPEHTAECGYGAAVAGQPCSHEGKCSADTCGYVPAQPGVPCGHKHDETCGWSAGKDEVPCDKGCAQVDENGVIIHVEGCAYAPAVAETPCSHAGQCSLEVCGYVAPVEGVKCGHENDGTCGYVQAVDGGSCGFVCTQCAQQSDPDQGEAVCTCDVKCNEQVNADCPVCSVSTEGCKGKAAEDVPTCNCADKCTEGAVNLDCPLCSAEHADLSGCIGKAAPVCNCADQCTAEKVKADCPVCGGENADLTACKGTPAPAVTENAKAVQSLIDALPTLEEVQAMTMEEQGNIYNQTQAAYGAYEQLTGEEKATVNGAEIFETLLTYFDTLVNPTEDVAQVVIDGKTQTYASLADAVNACPNGGTVTLLSNITLDAEVSFTKNCTLDLDVYAITVNKTYAISVDAGTLTVKAGSGDIRNGSVNLAVDISSRATLNVEGSLSCGVGVSGEIAGGTFNGDVANDEGATITGGTFNGDVANDEGATITGGTFNGDVANFKATIAGGTFNGSVINNGGTITGGSFKSASQPSWELPEGKVWKQSGEYWSLVPTVGPFLVEGGTEGVDYSWNGTTLSVLTSTHLTISMAEGYTTTDACISCQTDANLTLNGVNISTTEWSTALYGSSSLNLTLVGNNTLTGSWEGISANSVTINGGTLTARGDQHGINALSSVTINGGSVTAEGGVTGIISASSVTINGGSGTATGAMAAFYIEPYLENVYITNGTWDQQTVSWAPVTAPNITTPPADITVAPGGAAKFSVTATGTPTLAYQWQVSTDGTTWETIVGATGDTYSFTAAETDNGRKFQCVVTNSQGVATSKAATLTVSAAAKFGDTSYVTLEEALAALNASENGGTITLLQDIELTKDVTVSKDCTLVINENEITSENSSYLHVSKDCSLTVDGEVKCKVYIDNGGTIVDGTFWVVTGDENGISTIKGGTFYDEVTNCTITGGLFADVDPDTYNTIPDDYTSELGEDLLYRVFHVNHTVTTWTANKETATISGPCTVCGEPLWATLTAPKDAVYTGSPITATVEKSTNWVGSEPTVAYENNTNATTDTTKAKATMTMGGQSVSVTFEIAKATPTVTAPTANDRVYDGTAKALLNPGEATGGMFLYSLNGTDWSDEIPTAADAGKYNIQWKVVGDSNHNDAEGGTIKVTISQSGTVIPEGTVTTHLTIDGEPQPDFTYGDTIIVKAKPELTNQKPSGLAALFSFLVPQAKEMAVFYDGKQVSDPVKADAEGWYIMTVDSTLIGANPTEPLTVQFKGTANQSDAVQTVTVTIAPKEITVTGVKAVDRPYEPGNKTVALDLSNGDIVGVLDCDKNDVNLYVGTVGTVESAAAGTGKTVSFNPFTLIGKKAANYTVKEQPKLTVNITKLDVTVTADSFHVVAGDTMPTLTYKVTGLVEEEPLPEGMVKLGCDANLNKVGEYPITASGDSTYGNYNISYVNGKLTVQEKTVPVTGVTLNEKLTLDEGKKETLNAIIAPANATNKKVTWKSSDETVATVDANGTVTAKAAGTAIITVTTEDGGFEAKCEITVKKTFTVKFDSKDGTPAPKDQTVTKNGTVNKPADPAKKDKNGKDMTFGGWFTDTTWKTKWDFEKDTVTKDTTLYAQWLYTYKVDFRDNTSARVSNMPDNIEAYSTEDTLKIRIPANKPKRSGYSFAGWYKTSDHSGTRYNPGDDLPMDGNTKLTLYARWKEVDPTNAKTGDYIMIAVGVLAVSGAALAGLLVYSKKKKK